MKPKSTIFICVLIVATFLCAGMAWGQDIKARMRVRLPQVKALKSGGKVGENNQGYLTILKQANAQKQVVEAENSDRRAIYGVIAKKQGTTPKLVGQRRAMQIAKSAVPGTWVQGPKGKWKQK